ncbi:hypothetical protein M5K25_023172 [Dendrobium thyrsiflorum]|uniref:Reverse transcriptase zinc-binding domain-containing protein n=1 Tax=Dendrobium thyrsiflorum TaxID=117978 RepID=A0ABD0UES4_DENTH
MGYYKQGNSRIWKRLCDIKWQMEPYIFWELGVGNGNWLNNHSVDQLLSTNSKSNMKVSQVWTNDSWDYNKLREMLPEVIIQDILNIHFNIQNEDKNIPSTASVFLWRLWNHFVPTDDILINKGFYLVSKCQCCYHVENYSHIFITSPIAVRVWLYFEEVFHLSYFNANLSIRQVVTIWFSKSRGNITHLVCALILMNLWFARNNSRFNSIPMDANRIIGNIKDRVYRLFKVLMSLGFIYLEQFRFPGKLCLLVQIAGSCFGKIVFVGTSEGFFGLWYCVYNNFGLGFTGSRPARCIQGTGHMWLLVLGYWKFSEDWLVVIRVLVSFSFVGVLTNFWGIVDVVLYGITVTNIDNRVCPSAGVRFLRFWWSLMKIFIFDPSRLIFSVLNLLHHRMFLGFSVALLSRDLELVALRSVSELEFLLRTV